MYTIAQEKKFLLKKFQPPTFKGEGTEVEKLVETWLELVETWLELVETWLEQLGNYFNEARTDPANRAMFGMFKLAIEAKLWWKQ